MQRLDKIRQLFKFDNSFDKPYSAKKQKINYNNVILTISFYSVMSFLKEIVNLMTHHEILISTIDINTDALNNFISEKNKFIFHK
jgi:hypothetical protein